eukprot:7025971-Alexandrium_andersonii.AAC.1
MASALPERDIVYAAAKATGNYLELQRGAWGCEVDPAARPCYNRAGIRCRSAPRDQSVGLPNYIISGRRKGLDW